MAVDDDFSLDSCWIESSDEEHRTAESSDDDSCIGCRLEPNRQDGESTTCSLASSSSCCQACHEEQTCTECSAEAAAANDHHPLIVAAHHNTTQNRLCSLPDIILIRIMHQLDRVSLACLHRTSRVFLRLYAEGSSANFPGEMLTAIDYMNPNNKMRINDNDNNNNTKAILTRPWPHAAPKFTPEEKRTFHARLFDDGHCLRCRSREETRALRLGVDGDGYASSSSSSSSSFSSLYCSGCRKKHPEFFFSREQRGAAAAADDDGDDNCATTRRVCIGHSGYVRLCEHKIVRWSEIQEHLAKGKNHHLSFALCDHFSHYLPCSSSSSTSRQQQSWSDSIERVLNNCGLPPLTVARQVARKMARKEASPALFASMPICKGVPSIQVMCQWTVHVSLPKTSTSTSSGGPRWMAEEVQATISSMLRQKQSRFTCPQPEPHCTAGKGLFDPNHCNCAEYRGQDVTGWIRPLPGPTTTTTTACTKDKLSRFAPRVSSRHHAMFQQVSLSPCSNKHKMKKKKSSGPEHCCMETSHVTQVFDSRSSGPPSKPPDLINLPVTRGWLLMLDPDSYSLTDDEEGKHRWWCDDPECQMYYGYSWSRLAPLLSSF